MTKRYCFITSFGVEQQLIESKYVSLYLSYFQFRGKDYEGENVMKRVIAPLTVVRTIFHYTLLLLKK